MKNFTPQNLLRISSLLLLLLNACGKQGAQPMIQEHRVSSAAGATPQKLLRQQCLKQVKDTTISDRVGGICTFNPAVKDPTQQYSLTPVDRKMKLAHATTKDNVPKETVTINAGVSFFGKTTMPLDAQKDLIINAIHDDCLLNMQSFWNQSDILLDLQLSRAVSGTIYDQTLSLEYAPLSVATTHSPTADAADFQLQIEEWGHGTIQFSTSVAECNDAAKVSTKLPSGVEADRSACRKKSNQQFCLALNKMVGHWMGAVDKTDLNCYPPATTPAPAAAAAKDVESTTDTAINTAADTQSASDSVAATTPATPAAPVAATTPVATDAKTVLASFMTFLVNPVPTATQLAQTPAATTSTPAAAAPAPSAKDIEKDLRDKADLADAIIQADPANSINRTPAPTPKPSTPTADSVVDQSADPSYAPWLSYQATKDDLALILGCDFDRAEKDVKANRQAPPPAHNKTTTTPATNRSNVAQKPAANSKK